MQEHVLFTCNKCEFDIETQTNLKTHNKYEHVAKDCSCSFTSGENDNIKVVDARSLLHLKHLCNAENVQRNWKEL